MTDSPMREMRASKALVGISRTTRLSKGQMALYELIVDANKRKFIISRERLKMVYLNEVQRSPDTWSYWKDREELSDGTSKPIGGYEPRPDWQTDMNMMCWFTNALGALIKKGYLTVIPKFNLSDTL